VIVRSAPPASLSSEIFWPFCKLTDITISPYSI
jgi:hypothetical protein